MPAFQDLTNQTFSRLTVISKKEKDERGRIQWRCRCECGKEIVTLAAYLKIGDVKSCGCLKRDSTIARSTKHGQATRKGPTKLYVQWAGMMARCNDPNHIHYSSYGGAGIGVCERWKEFANFAADMPPAPSLIHMLDRFPNLAGNYEPGNVIWSTPEESAQHRKNNVLSPEKVHLIRALRTAGKTHSQIAAIVEVSVKNVEHVLSKRSWANIPDENQN